MGSSPVTATILTGFRVNMDLSGELEAFFSKEAPLDPGDAVVVAFSGGPDSTALLLGLLGMSRLPGIRLAAAHLDHAMDPGSASRACEAARTAARLGVPFITERAEPRENGPADSPEAAGRRARYDFLERVRRDLGARWIATAHHRDDQAETVLLRLLFGSGLEGLAGIRPVHGRVVRPLLGVPRAMLVSAVTASGLTPVDDPTNRNPNVPRNRVRHHLLPSLEPDLAPRLARLAGRARAAGLVLDRRLAGILPLHPAREGVAVERGALERLPEEILPFALAWLHRRAGAPYPAAGAARAELLRQIGNRENAGCDCGGGWRWEVSGDLLVLRRCPRGKARERVPDFTYTLEIPGELHIPEISAKVRVERRAVEPWMFEGSPHRAGLALPLVEGDRVTIRNRRPGDRIHPLGASGSRRLKEVLIDRRVPRQARARLPLLCVEGRIAWAPGVTIDERFRLDGHATAWIAEIETIAEVTTT
jgi:tRNA(Ile)-lysidine synthase